jgi:PAS domain S-box-containing protein
MSDLEKLRAANKRLEKENEKLRKTNSVLIHRIEQGWGNHSDAYQTFENAVLLAEKSEEKVAKLSHIISQLEKANQQTSEAQQETKLAQQRLADSIESIFDAFALFDDQHRIILANNRFYELWARTKTAIVLGKTLLADLVKTSLDKGILSLEINGQAQQPPGRFGNHIYQLHHNRWVQTSEKQTLDGGLVLTFTDITYLKNSEARQREEALEQQAQLLESTINNMSQGVTLVDANYRILVWNERFVEISGIAHEALKQGLDFKQLIANNELCTGPDLLPVAADSSDKEMFEYEKTLADGRVILLRRHLIPGGGFVNTYTDITERSQQQQALRDSEQALKAAYEELEERVKQRTQEISQINQTLREQIDEKSIAEAKLLEAKREAEAANISKTKFLAATSHDLLQPLNAAVLFADLLKQKALPVDIQGLVQSLAYSLENIESLIGTLVDISKLEAGAISPEFGVFNIDELLANLANEFGQQAGQQSIQFDFVPATVMVHTDSQLLARILRNFLTNALRYTQDGVVLLGARRRPEGLEIQVVDTGVGIPGDEMDKIFNEFHRGMTHSSREDRGLGLGLAIVDKISHMLGHQVKVNSVLGKGSCFSVLVPYAETLNQESMAPLQIPVFPIDKTLQNAHVLVIDNDVSICDGMKMLLQGWGCAVSTLHSSSQIEKALQNGFAPMPNLVIVDYHLDDGLSGLDIAKQINLTGTRNIPVLMVTANYSVELRQEIRKLGYHLLNKPVKPVKLKMAMNHLLGDI